jgi:hypothetical protein
MKYFHYTERFIREKLHVPRTKKMVLSVKVCVLETKWNNFHAQ